MGSVVKKLRVLLVVNKTGLVLVVAVDSLLGTVVTRTTREKKKVMMDV